MAATMSALSPRRSCTLGSASAARSRCTTAWLGSRVTGYGLRVRARVRVRKSRSIAACHLGRVRVRVRVRVGLGEGYGRSRCTTACRVCP